MIFLLLSRLIGNQRARRPDRHAHYLCIGYVLTWWIFSLSRNKAPLAQGLLPHPPGHGHGGQGVPPCVNLTWDFHHMEMLTGRSISTGLMAMWAPSPIFLTYNTYVCTIWPNQPIQRRWCIHFGPNRPEDIVCYVLK